MGMIIEKPRHWSEEERPIKTLYFIGQFNPLTQYNAGDVVIDSGKTKLFTGEEFITISHELNSEAKCKLPKILPKTCTRCGAPVNSSHSKCMYCDCEY
jgi:hypothetical protein